MGAQGSVHQLWQKAEQHALGVTFPLTDPWELPSEWERHSSLVVDYLNPKSAPCMPLKCTCTHHIPFFLGQKTTRAYAVTSHCETKTPWGGHTALPGQLPTCSGTPGTVLHTPHRPAGC